jgi:outer membrane receptor for ferrienterochelin and colicins
MGFSSAPTQREDKHADGHGQDKHEEHVESILVLSTRLGCSIKDEPIPVEVIVREELEEKAISPNNLWIKLTFPCL